MAKVISTAGMTPFEVVIEQTVPGMVRFVRAMSKTGAKVSNSPKKTLAGAPMTFVVWLNPMYVAMFESFCKPAGFQFVSANAIGVDGSVKVKTPGP